jgi:DNA (cytosine-5)-methyltransferase 1
MFCGIGTIRLGMEQAGHECVYSIEWDKHKRRIYGVIFGKEPEGSDIRECRGTELPRADCWCFGAPCQDFSIAGERKGLEGDRSSLVREVFRLVRETPEEYRPKYLLYENVKGMLSSNKGLDYLEILFEMASLGYDIQYELLNSKDFGVPQIIYIMAEEKWIGITQQIDFSSLKSAGGIAERIANLNVRPV